MNHVDKAQRGFTVIELMLAMTSVSVLMITIALTVVQLANIYNKGTTLRAVDQAGRAISRDMQTTLATSQLMDVGSDGKGGINYRIQSQVGSDGSDPDGGRLCTGTYSYVWNIGKALKKPVNTYQDDTEQIRLVKVRDAGAQYCNDLSMDINKADATELLSSGDRELALQSFRIKPEAVDAVTQQALYRIVMELGTNDEDSLDRNVTINTIDTRCKPPSDDASQRDFCAVNQFDFTVLAGNRGNS